MSKLILSTLPVIFIINKKSFLKVMVLFLKTTVTRIQRTGKRTQTHTIDIH